MTTKVRTSNSELIGPKTRMNRGVAVATRRVPTGTTLTAQDEHDLKICGPLVFLDPGKPSARSALDRLSISASPPSSSPATTRQSLGESVQTWGCRRSLQQDHDRDLEGAA